MVQESNNIFFGKVIKREDDYVMVRCYLGFDNIVDKKIDGELLKNATSDYLLIGVQTRMGTSKITITDAGVYTKKILRNYVGNKYRNNKEKNKKIPEPNNNT
jgi:hypothetical protein